MARTKPVIRLDEVSTFGNKLRFLIPHEWVEEEEAEDYYLYHAPEADTGWFRASLITVVTVEPAAKRLREIVRSQAYKLDRQSGNYYQSSTKDSVLEGDRIRLYFWTVANAVPPDRVLKAVFSYTILADRINDAATKRTVRLLGGLVRRAIFS